jgi:cob(I)alamin adenosyltransferase
VSKTSLRVEAYGAVDEASSAIGLARATVRDPLLDGILLFTQQRLFNCSGSLAMPGDSATGQTPMIDPEDVRSLEQAIDRFTDRSGEMTHFVIEGGCETACRLQLARAVTRRAERRVLALNAVEPVAEQVLCFLNRCSDLLFAAARYANATQDCREEHWDPAAERPAL